MKADSSITVNYANLTYAFMKFQEQYKNLCQSISESKRSEISKSLKKVNSFFFEYSNYVKSKDFRDYLKDHLKSIREELYNDDNFTSLCIKRNKTPTQGIEFTQRYYYYLVKILKFIGIFGDELSMTFMPNKTDREKLLRYWNNNSFFEQFTYYKSSVADSLADFDIKNFKKGFSYFLGFYFAYYLFVDENSRYLCENMFSNILNIVTDKYILGIIVTPNNELSNEKKKILKEIDYTIHDSLNNIFGRCNYSYSLYGIMPRKQEKILIDRRAI